VRHALTRVRPHLDVLLAAALFFGYAALLVGTSRSVGFTRDEGFYFAASRHYGAWFELLWRDPALALTRETVDRHWAVNREHPALIKTLFALSNRWLGGAFAEVSTSFRFPAMVLSSASVALIFMWGRRSFGRSGALVAALSFAFMPRPFFHAHLACFDLPVSAMWLIASYVYSRALATPRWGWLLGAGVVYGFLLDTKHNSWLFPFALVAHFALTRGRALLSDLRGGRPFWNRLPRAWLSLLLVSPLTFVALWPWLWHDTFARFADYVAFHTGHEYYNMEFLGRTYWKPPMPRAYAWLMTLATVPLVTLLLSLAGGVAAARARSCNANARSDWALWAVSVAMSFAPWLSSDTPIFGGTKHWMTAYPFLCLFAGLGFTKLQAAVRAAAPRLAIAPLLGLSVLLGPVLMTLHSHPFGLSAYMPLVGGAPGAATLGLNRAFWGYTTESLAPFVNERAPKRATVYVHDTALQSFGMFQEDERLRRDLRGSLNIAASDVALYHHEPHMSRVEHQIWLEYGTVAPSAIATFDGVPIAWVYLRPGPIRK
jgi:4-amino-4-deoxy-L-arabinose transferase-like glycosyltransferase